MVYLYVIQAKSSSFFEEQSIQNKCNMEKEEVLNHFGPLNLLCLLLNLQELREHCPETEVDGQFNLRLNQGVVMEGAYE